MRASTMTSAVSVLALGTEVSPAATPPHSPHGGETGRGKACVKAAFCAPRSGREPRHEPHPGHAVSTWGSVLGLAPLFENIFDIFSLPQVPFIHRGENLAWINGTTSLKKPPVECGRCNVPVDSPNVPKSTSRRFRHFKQLLRNIFEVEKKKDSLR
jgi:hypothetical protein